MALPEYDGLQVFKANQPIIELLKSRGALLHEEKVEHSYPHCWRCHNPVIFRATEQWFISMETPMPGGGTFRSRALDEIKKVKWDPAWGEERISNMVATRPDWCISRQRVWGVPIAIFVCTGCKKPLKDPQVNRKVVELFATSGADAWYTPESDGSGRWGEVPALRWDWNSRKKPTSSTCGLSRDAATWSSRETRPNQPWPSDLYLEGGDQYRGWFMSSLLCSLGARRQRSVQNGGYARMDAG